LTVTSSSFIDWSSSLLVFQFLAGRAELFVDGLQLLVGGLEFLGGSLGVLDGVLQVQLELAYFFLELADEQFARRVGRLAFAGAHAFLDLVEHHQDQRLASLFLLQGPYRDVEEHRAAVLLALHQARFHASRGLGCLEQRGAQLQANVGAHVVEQVVRRLAARALQEAPDAVGQVQHLVVEVDEHAGRRELLQRELVERREARTLRSTLPVAAPHRRMQAGVQVRGHVADQRHVAPRGQLRIHAVDAVFLVDRREHAAHRVGRFRGAQEQVAAGIQCDAEGFQRVGLGGAVEVDQQVAAADQVEPRERRIAQQVVQRKKHRLAHRGRHAVLVVVLHEELPHARRRHVLHDALRVRGLARGRDGALVDVGGEDLDLQGLGLRIGLLAQQDAQRIRLLAGGAAGHPGAQLLAGFLALDQLRDGFMVERIEGFGVPEELVTLISMSCSRGAASWGLSRRKSR
jgi:hypothetical protein